MSTYYDFMVEAKYKDKWYNIDLHTKDLTESCGINTLQPSPAALLANWKA